MADKQQNVFVNFKFNTAEIEKVTQLTNRANDAANKLQSSAEKSGKALDNSFRQPIQSIGAMQNALARLKTQLEVATDPKRVKQLSDQYKQLKTQLDQATKSAFNNAKAISEVGKEASKTSSLLGEVGKALTLVFSAAVVKQAVDIGLSLARLSGNAEGVERAFARAFPNSVNTLNQLREATHGAVNDLELMQKTLQAANLGIAIEKLPILLEFAAARAQQTGESVDYLVDSIVTGIGRKSVLKLDNLGLSTTRLKEQFDGAAIASKSVGEVTAGIADIAKVELEKMGGYVETAATKVSQLESNWENLRKTLAKKIESGPIIDFFNESFQGLDALLKGQQGLRKEQVDASAAAQAERVIQGKAFQDLKDNQAAQVDLLIQEIAERQRLVRVRQSEIDQAVKRRSQIIENLGFLEDEELATRNLNEMITAQAKSRDVLITSIPLLKKYIDELRKIGDKEELGTIESKRKEIEAIQQAIEKTRSSSDLSSRLGIGKLITDLAVAEAELNALLNGPENKEFKLKFNTPEAIKDFEKLIKDLKASVPDGAIVLPVTPVIEMDFWDELGEQFNEQLPEITDAGLQIFTDQLISFEEAEVASLQNRLNNLRNFYDEQQILAGDNDRAKQELRLKEERETAALQKKIAQKEKEARRFSVIIDTAAGIVRAFATSPTIAQGIINAALVAAQGASQLAIINRTQPRFKDGVINLKGPGTGTSDSIQARLSKGESVMTARETQNSMGILKDIRAKKLDDKVLKDLKLSSSGVSYAGMDDSRIIKELQELKERQPDIIEQSGKLYKQYTKGSNYKVKSRISAMGY
jgi:hypothetical protein